VNSLILFLFNVFRRFALVLRNAEVGSSSLLPSTNRMRRKTRDLGPAFRAYRGRHGAQGIQFPVDGRRLNGLGLAFVQVPLPAAGQPLAFPLLDAMGGEIPEEQRTEEPLLEALGFIETQRGRGTFFCARRPQADRSVQLEQIQPASRRLLSQAYLAGLSLRGVVKPLLEADRELTQDRRLPSRTQTA